MSLLDLSPREQVPDTLSPDYGLPTGETKRPSSGFEVYSVGMGCWGWGGTEDHSRASSFPGIGGCEEDRGGASSFDPD